MQRPKGRFRSALIAAALTVASLAAVATPADAIVCHDYPGGCCRDVEILKKTILRIDC